jgi:uncharacterized protein YbbC (DUF1343 family)
LAIAALLGSCATPSEKAGKRPAPEATAPLVEEEPAPPPEPFPVMLGIDVLEAQGFGVLAGKRVGLLTHDAAANRAGEPTWSVLAHAPAVDLVCLFAAEHGLDGKAPASAVVPDQTHGPTGKPVYSLYGNRRRPTRELLRGIDVLVIDLQDIGSRSYTFVSAMREALEVGIEAGIEVVVLDRPNPLGGRKVDGPMVDAAWRSYVGAFPVPYVHGLTIGELARMALASPGVLEVGDAARAAARVTIVPMRGWKRSMRWPDTGLAWRPTSPYIGAFEAVEGYPMTGLGCLLGGWAHGVGKDHPFRGLHFRGRTADALVRELGALHVPGLGFRKLEIVDGSGKKTHGVVVDITDWEKLRPTELSFHLMRLACAWGGANPFAKAPAKEKQSFLRHVGSEAWWAALVRDGARVDVGAFVDGWAAEAAAFRDRSRAWWLYPDDEPLGVPITATAGRGSRLGR